MIIAQQHISLFFFLIKGKDGRDGRDGRDGGKVGLKLRFLKIKHRHIAVKEDGEKLEKKLPWTSPVLIYKKLMLISA